MSQNGFEFQERSPEGAEQRPSRARASFEMNTDLWFAAHTPPAESQTSKFIGFSSVLHAMLFAGILVLAQAPRAPEVETITIELEDLSGPRPIPQGATKLQSEGTAAQAGAQHPIEAATSAEDIIAPSAPTKPAARIKVKAASRASRPSQALPKKPAATKAPPRLAVQATNSEVEVPASLEDLETPDLDENMATAARDLTPNESDLASAFSRIDRAQQDEADREREALEGESAALEQEGDSALRDLEKAYESDEQRMKAIAEARSRREQEALAAATARNQAEALRRAEAAGQAEAKRQAALRAAQAKADGDGAGSGSNRSARAAAPIADGDHGGLGQTGRAGGNSGAPQGAAFGAPKAIRSLDDLRQMPGNPIPAYNEQERMLRQQGQVVFLAYVSKNGVPVDFRQLRSTGYTNLDAKTLQTLKRWKFYPGQEGWVEIPFRWDLRGGPKETSALFRR